MCLLCRTITKINGWYDKHGFKCSIAKEHLIKLVPIKHSKIQIVGLPIGKFRIIWSPSLNSKAQDKVCFMEWQKEKKEASISQCMYRDNQEFLKKVPKN